MRAPLDRPFHALRRLGETIRVALCALNRIQFSAPWDPDRPTC